MRKTVMALAGAAALALSSAASAAVTVNSGTVVGLNNPNPSAAGSIQTVGTTTTINFGANALTTTMFSASFVIHNDAQGLYNITLGASDPNTFFDTATFNGSSLTNIFNNQNFVLIPAQNLGIGDYTFALTGHTSGGGSFTGNVTISAVPEATTWTMMILGFGAVGMTMRGRRRKTVLAQVA